MTARVVKGLTGPGGLLVDYAGGTPTYFLTNPHGDVAEVLNSAGSITDEPVTDEFGVPEAGTSGEYGYLGSHRKVTDTATGLILMGARGYMPATGRFLQTDPVPGGGANTYVYPTDPINQLDLTGQCWSWCDSVYHKARDFGAKAITGYTIAKNLAVSGMRGFAWQFRYDLRYVIRVLYDDFHSWPSTRDRQHRRPLF